MAKRKTSKKKEEIVEDFDPEEEFDDSEDYNDTDDFLDEDNAPISNNYSKSNTNARSNDNFDYMSDDLGDSPIESDNSRWEMDPDDVFNVIERSLRGQALSSDGRKYIKIMKPLCNNEGVSQIMMFLRSFVNKNIILSNLDAREVNSLMLLFHTSLTSMLTSKWKDFNMNKFDLDYIVSLIEGNIYPTLKRGYGGIERKIRRDKYRLTESMNSNEGRGMFSMPSLFGGNKKQQPPQNRPEEIQF